MSQHSNTVRARHRLMNAIHASVAAIGMSVIATGATAADTPRSVAVGYADLNLSAHDDSRMLYSRLKSAARAVCSDYESRELARKRAWKLCYEQALANAVTSVAKTSITALHAADKSMRMAQSKQTAQPRS